MKKKDKVIYTLKLTTSNNKYKVEFKLNATNEERFFILQEFCKQTNILLQVGLDQVGAKK